MQFSDIIEQSPSDWETTMRQMYFWQFSTHKIYINMCEKLSELHCKATLASNRMEKVTKWRKNVGQICTIVFLAFQIFSPELEKNKTSKCYSESFPCIMTYILCVGNCQSYILTSSCFPIAGSLFYIVRKFHGPRISECKIRKKTGKKTRLY